MRYFFCSVVLVLAIYFTSHAQIEDLMPGITVQLNGEPNDGYVFVGVRSFKPADTVPSSLMILDKYGQPIWFAKLGDDSSIPYNLQHPYDFKPIPGNRYLYFEARYNSQWTVLNEDFEIIDTLLCNNFNLTDFHDIIIEPDGKRWMLCDTFVERDLSHITTTNGTPGSATATVIYQIIQQLDSSGNVISNWHGLDHLPIEDSDPIRFDDPNFSDYLHTNTVTLAPDDHFLISSRHLNEITLVDAVTGDVAWRFGGKGNQFQLIGTPYFFGSQHDAHIDENGILRLFDNASQGPAPQARYLEFQMDTVNMTATLVREIKEPNGRRSLYMGNATPSENGHVFVNWARLNPDTYYPNITEFDSAGQVVMDLTFAFPFFTYRAHKVDVPQGFPRPIIGCVPGTNKLVASSGHSQYIWNTGDSGQEITVTQPGTYRVWVQHGIGFLSSEDVVVTDINDLCSVVNRPEDVTPTMDIFPNPGQDMLNIEIPHVFSGEWSISITDLLGRPVIIRDGKGPVDLTVNSQNWSDGLYLIEWRQGRQIVRKKWMKK